MPAKTNEIAIIQEAYFCKKSDGADELVCFQHCQSRRLGKGGQRRKQYMRLKFLYILYFCLTFKIWMKPHETVIWKSSFPEMRCVTFVQRQQHVIGDGANWGRVWTGAPILLSLPEGTCYTPCFSAAQDYWHFLAVLNNYLRDYIQSYMVLPRT